MVDRWFTRFSSSLPCIKCLLKFGDKQLISSTDVRQATHIGFLILIKFSIYQVISNGFINLKNYKVMVFYSLNTTNYVGFAWGRSWLSLECPPCFSGMGLPILVSDLTNSKLRAKCVLEMLVDVNMLMSLSQEPCGLMEPQIRHNLYILTLIQQTWKWYAFCVITLLTVIVINPHKYTSPDCLICTRF